jgi:protein-disulfide isomerase
VVNRVRSTTARRRRVYTIRTAWLLALLALLAPVAAAQTPPSLTIEPSMVKGSDKAPVTIVEFSDYQ